METKDKERILALSLYILEHSQQSCNGWVLYSSLLLHSANRETASPLGCSQEVVKTDTNTIWTGQKTKVVRWKNKVKEWNNYLTYAIIPIQESPNWGVQLIGNCSAVLGQGETPLPH